MLVPRNCLAHACRKSSDNRFSSIIQKALLRLMEECPSFVIAHRLSTIREADNVIVINEGEIVEQGSQQHLLDKKGFFLKLCMAQIKGQGI
jgi:ABC-type multidrug transport system fused ATPase/permease subunit